MRNLYILQSCDEPDYVQVGLRVFEPFLKYAELSENGKGLKVFEV
jgi:hypothetical protein